MRLSGVRTPMMPLPHPLVKWYRIAAKYSKATEGSDGFQALESAAGNERLRARGRGCGDRWDCVSQRRVGSAVTVAPSGATGGSQPDLRDDYRGECVAEGQPVQA